MKAPLRSLQSLLAFACISLLSIPGGHADDINVVTDFEGASAKVESIDQTTRTARITPAGDPERGWPCWWSLRLEGVSGEAAVTIDLGGSPLPARNNGKNTGKPLAASWAMPMRAAYSIDGETWQHTAPGKRVGDRIQYQVPPTAKHVAWGPPFTPKDTASLISHLEQTKTGAQGFQLATTLEGRAVRAVRFGAGNKLGIWVHARQHAWESGASWVARGFAEWLGSNNSEARWIREHAEVVIVPIMDVDNTATGNGGKEAAPRDHNRDWDDKPVHPEVAAAQTLLKEWAGRGRLDLFLDLHNPAPGDLRPFFYIGPDDFLSPDGKKRRTAFLAAARQRISDPLPLEEKPKVTGPTYHPLWRQISGQWVNDHGNPHTVSACLETSWNTPHSTTEGYRTVGKQLGQAVVDYLKANPRP